MKRDFSKHILNFNGTLVPSEVANRTVTNDKGQPMLLPPEGQTELAPATFGEICINALSIPRKGEVGAVKTRRFKLALRIADGGEQDIELDDAAFLKDEVDKAEYGPLIFGRVSEFLEP